jgi:hypothetical protein
MKNLINKLMIPFAILVLLNIIGFVYHLNYEGATVGSIIGMFVAMLTNEIRAKFD